MANSAEMSGGHLHAVVDAIATAGSRQLAKQAAAGAPVPFDLVEAPSSGEGAPLFSYRPRTREFVEDHADLLQQLPEWGPALNVLAGFDGLGDYLLSHGEAHVPIDARERADLVLRVLLASMHAETGDFLHTPGRTAAASAELARCVLAGRTEATVIVPILGVLLETDRIELEHGLALVRDDAMEDLPREVRSPVRGRPGTIAVVETLEQAAGAGALATARPRLRGLLTALRLYDQPAPALAPIAWSRVRGGGWASNPFIGTSARALGTLTIPAAHADAVRGFHELVVRGGRVTGSASWALRRFELACERADHAESLTDALLALRALLEADAPGSGLLPERLAALCARTPARPGLRDRVQVAEALEIALMQGTTVDAVHVREASIELRGHLRALLRDVACGHLPVELAPVADRQRADLAPIAPAEAVATPVAPVELAVAAPVEVAEVAPVAVGPEPAPAAVEPVAAAPAEPQLAERWSAVAPDIAAPAPAPAHAPVETAAASAPQFFDIDELDPLAELDASFDDFDAVIEATDTRDPELADEPIIPLSAELALAAEPQPAPVDGAAHPEPVAVDEPSGDQQPVVYDTRDLGTGESAVLSVGPMERVVPSLVEREVMPNGERFEDAFVRSLTEGPSAIRGGGRFRSRR